MKINITYDSSVTSGNFTGGAAEETVFKNDVAYAVNILEGLFTNPVTIRLVVSWGEIQGKKLPSNFIAENRTSENLGYGYSTVKAALLKLAKASGDPAQLAAYATLPAKNPVGGDGFVLTPGEARALGLINPNKALPNPSHKGHTMPDGYVAFATDAQMRAGEPWDFHLTPTSGQDFITTAELEITEEMGRSSVLGGYVSSTANDGTITSAYSIMDLFRYKSAGGHVVRDTAPGGVGSTAFFSYDNGATNLAAWNNHTSSGDLGDWYPGGPAPNGNDAFSLGGPNGNAPLTTTDVTLMNVLGWDTAYPPGDIPNGWVTNASSAGIDVLSGGYLEVAGLFNAVD
jgi:hypothetical protein